MSMMLAYVFWLSSATWAAKGETTRQVAAAELREAVLRDAMKLAAGARPVSEGATVITSEGATVITREELPPLLATQLSDTSNPSVSYIDKQHDRIVAAAAVGDGRWVLAHFDIVYDHRGLWVRLGIELLTTVFGIGVLILAMARLITTPLERLRRSLRRVTEVGMLSEVGRIPVVRRDEIGELTNEFNHMLDVFDELASAARAVAAGDLRVRIDGPGDLQDSFRSMVARLSEMVVQIREAALEVAGATAEIHAATREQERGASQQSDEIREVSIAIQRLADSAGDISKAAAEVLANAEQTRKRADEVVSEISELGRHITRVGELLELIRDIADRSDLLALNGSLEATRAGEAGRGFALVAAEMRRLAERVTGTVADVRQTVAAIGTSNSATVDATQDSRELAGSTTQAARRIVDVIHAQGNETELVSTAVRTIADAVASSAAAITQTRASADGLRERAEQLEQLLEQFEVRGN
jgi:methyl-accepting chemotaxis protein